MNPGKPTLDWLVLEDADEEYPVSPVMDPPHRPRRDWRVLAAGFIGLLFALSIAGRWLVGTADEGLTILEDELRTTIAVEDWRDSHAGGVDRRTGDDTLLSDQLSTVAATTEVVDVTFHGNQAAVEVLEVRDDGYGLQTALRTLRFYRNDGRAWIRDHPNDAFLGAPLTLETEHLVFHCHMCDRYVVEDSAPVLDDAYTAMRAAIGMPEHSDRLIVVVDTAPYGAKRPVLIENELHVPSPVLLRVPADMEPDDVLVWQALPLLAVRTLNDAQAAQALPSRWGYMVPVIYHYLLAAHNDLQAEWRADVLELWRQNYSEDARHFDQNAADLLELCRKHHVSERAAWLDGSGAVALCKSLRPAEIARLLAGSDFMSIWQVQAAPFYPYGGPYVDRVDPILATTALDYAASVYGPEAVATLWRGFHDYDSWAELIPAVFSVPLQEFDQAVQDYWLRLPDHPPAHPLGAWTRWRLTRHLKCLIVRKRLPVNNPGCGADRVNYSATRTACMKRGTSSGCVKKPQLRIAASVADLVRGSGIFRTVTDDCRP